MPDLNSLDASVIRPDGTQAWYLNGQLHREDGPAIIWPNGTQVWYRNGRRHREDGPAIIGPNGTQVWYRNGRRHREDGPAIIGLDGYQAWWQNGIQVSAQQGIWWVRAALRGLRGYPEAVFAVLRGGLNVRLAIPITNSS